MISTYHAYAGDVFGVASSWIINVFMSWLFIRVLLNRLRAASVSLNARLTDLRPWASLLRFKFRNQ